MSAASSAAASAASSAAASAASVISSVVGGVVSLATSGNSAASTASSGAQVFTVVSGGTVYTSTQLPSQALSTARLWDRLNYGPLTTTFTPSATCLSPYLVKTGDSDVYVGATCRQPEGTISLNNACLPGSVTGNWYDSTVALYSPGLVCPSAYFSACGMTRASGAARPTGANQASLGYFDVLTAGESMIGCCPSGFTCAFNNAYPFCTSLRPGSQGRDFTFFTSGCNAIVPAATTTTLSPPGGTYYYSAQAVFLVNTRFDSASFSASPTGSSTVGSTSVATSTSTTSSGTSTSDGLSSTAKIAIGVAVPVIIILGLVGVFLFFRRRRRGRQTVAPDSTTSHYEKPELQGSSGGILGGKGGVAYTTAELNAQDEAVIRDRRDLPIPAPPKMSELQGTNNLAIGTNPQRWNTTTPPSQMYELPVPDEPQAGRVHEFPTGSHPAPIVPISHTPTQSTTVLGSNPSLHAKQPTSSQATTTVAESVQNDKETLQTESPVLNIHPTRSLPFSDTHAPVIAGGPEAPQPNDTSAEDTRHQTPASPLHQESQPDQSQYQKNPLIDQSTTESTESKPAPQQIQHQSPNQPSWSFWKD